MLVCTHRSHSVFFSNIISSSASSDIQVIVTARILLRLGILQVRNMQGDSYIPLMEYFSSCSRWKQYNQTAFVVLMLTL